MTKQVNVKIDYINNIKYILLNCDKFDYNLIVNEIAILLNTKDIEKVKKIVNNFISDKLGVMSCIDILKRMFIY